MHLSTLWSSISLTSTSAPFQTRERGHRHPRREGAVHADKGAVTSLAGAANHQLSLLLSLRTSRGSTEVYAYAHGEGEVQECVTIRSKSCSHSARPLSQGVDEGRGDSRSSGRSPWSHQKVSGKRRARQLRAAVGTGAARGRGQEQAGQVSELIDHRANNVLTESGNLQRKSSAKS